MPPPSRFALNPAFAAAHGLKKDTDKDEIKVPSTTQQGATTKRLESMLQQARTTGKLRAANISLTYPLPDSVFDLRLGLSVDLDMKASAGATPLHFAEETLTSVDLSDNDIGGSMDERVVRYQQIQIMRWKRCGLEQIVDLSSLETLAILDLAGNCMEQILLSFLPQVCLQELDLSQNRLTSLDAVGPIEFPQLETLDLSSNQLSNLENTQLSTPRLRTLRASHNKLQSFPDFLQSATPNLQVLDLSHNHLNQSEVDLSEFSQLQSVMLAFNRLSAVPTIPQKVTKMDLTTNKLVSIKGLYKDSTQDSGLVDLLLQDNYLDALDADMIECCKRLQRLDLSANKLKNLPYQLGFLSQLTQLSLTGNPLFAFKSKDIENPTSLLQVLRNRAPKQDTDIQKPTTKVLSSCLHRNHSLQIPNQGNPAEVLAQLVNELQANPSTAFDITEKVVADKCGLEAVPESLFTVLQNIREISFCDNKLVSLPETLGSSCPKLSRLSLARNRMENLGAWFLDSPTLAWSTSLVSLDLSSNRVCEFPGSVFTKLPALEVLRMPYCKLRSVDDWTTLPSTLTILDLGDNVIEQIDKLVVHLAACCPALSILCLQQNYINRIPPTLGLLQDYCPNLRALDLKGNPQHGVRPEVLAKPAADQLVYLRNRLTAEMVAKTKNEIESLKEPLGVNNNEVVVEEGGDTTPTAPDPTPAPNAAVEEQISTEKATTASPVLDEIQLNITKLEAELESLSISQAKRYALKKSLAMERSKLIREERKLGLRK
eukprot:Nitzschia sp. Nitz4//scaffold34_size148208//51551//53857//NITZ4_002974-RA/size148208-processed-gene-0.39-mRNA-1//-1//CDS//3329548777//4560//frame0